jgi:CubicO group peptidase (beta-lactamase class C family)
VGRWWRWVRWYLAAYAVLVAVVVAPVVRPATGSTSIHRWVSDEVARSRTPGAAVVIVENGRVTSARGFGEGISVSTRFRLGSVSKSFVALAVMQLVESGQLSLDGPVQRYLPWFAIGGPRDAGRITLRHLLTHTSGIPRRTGLGSLEGGAAPTLEARLRGLDHVELHRAPGSGYEYANTNFEILGLVVETVSGVPYESYLADRVFEPLGMEDTTLEFVEPVQGHTRWFGLPVPSRLPYIAAAVPSGYVTTTAADMGRYLVAQLNGGGGVVSASGLAELHRPAVAGPHGAYGKGWTVGPFADQPAVWHHGNALVHSTTVVLLPGTGRGVAVMTSDASLRTLSSDRIATGVVRMLSREPPPPPGRAAARVFVVHGTMLFAFAAYVVEMTRRSARRRLLGLVLLHGIVPALLVAAVVNRLGSLRLAWMQMPDAVAVVVGGAVVLAGSGCTAAVLRAGRAFALLAFAHDVSLCETSCAKARSG